MRRLILLATLAIASASCSGGHEAALQAPAQPPPPAREPESCRPCHAEIVDRTESSAHRLAARRFDDAARPPAARIAADAPVDDLARASMSLRPLPDGRAELMVPDADGASEARALTHVLGGWRREDFLTPLAGGARVLPVSWSITRASWVEPLAEELGGPLDRTSPSWWTSPRRAHDVACSRCHPLPEGDAVSGIACASCHGDASAHVARKSGASDPTTWTRDAMRRATDDAWKGCAPCHATGNVRPKEKGLTLAAPLADVMLPATLAGPGGFNVSFRLDGAPSVAHGLEVQGLSTSPCFTRGGATCITCHDPHGGPGASMKDADPDASCRSCHAEIAKDAATHAGHPVATTPVPSSREERNGPVATRLPGCVDCHAPALLVFGKGDLARDHAISVPSPKLASEAGVADACASCHPNMTASALDKAVRREPGAPPRARERRMRAFAAAVRAGDVATSKAAVDALAEVVGDPGQDPGTRASAAHLLGAAGPAAASALPALAEARKDATDPALLIAAFSAHAKIGGDLAPLEQRMATETDWRVALAIASGIAGRGQPKGLQAVEAIYADESLPDIARSDAGVEMAVILLQSGSCQRASSVLTDAVAKDAFSVPAWLNLGVARACLGDADGARSAFVQVLALQPGHVLALRNLEALEVAQGAR